jgi:hypothetical protein
MKYTNPSAFRRALEDRLRQHSLKGGVPLVRLRKMVAFDRLLARQTQGTPGMWVLKGGFALQLRLKEVARTTKDIIGLFSRIKMIFIARFLRLGNWI